MFCTTCGNSITAEQAVCTKCGRATTVGMMQGGITRVSQHYRTLGILQIIYSVLHVLSGIAIVLVARFVLTGIFDHSEQHPPTFVQPMVEVVGWIVLCVSLVGLVGGIGLLSREPWARTVVLVAAFIELLNVPIGTALGIYTIWVLLSTGSEEEYRRMSFAHS